MGTHRFCAGPQGGQQPGHRRDILCSRCPQRVGGHSRLVKESGLLNTPQGQVLADTQRPSMCLSTCWPAIWASKWVSRHAHAFCLSYTLWWFTSLTEKAADHVILQMHALAHVKNSCTEPQSERLKEDQSLKAFAIHTEAHVRICRRYASPSVCFLLALSPLSSSPPSPSSLASPCLPSLFYSPHFQKISTPQCPRGTTLSRLERFSRASLSPPT